MNELLMFLGQALYAAMRMSSMQGLVAGRPLLAIAMDASQLLVMLLVLSPAVAGVNSGDWRAVACVVAGQAIGGYCSLRYVTKAQQGAGS